MSPKHSTAWNEEHHRQILLELAEKIRKMENAEDLLYDVAQLVGSHLQASRCAFDEVDREKEVVHVHRDYRAPGVEPGPRSFRIASFSQNTLADVKEGRTCVVSSSREDPRTASLYETVYKPNGYEAYILVPMLRNGKWLGSLWLSKEEPYAWSGAEIALLEVVAERVWIAVEKLRINDAMRESELRFRNMADFAPVMIWMTNADGACSYLSRSWFDFTGESQDSKIARVQPIHPEDQKKVEGALVGAHQEHTAFRMEYRLRRKDGAYRWVIDSAAPRWGSKGEFLGYIGSVMDITERRQLEMEREHLLHAEQQARKAAEETSRAKDEFLATLSHELRTPLNVILGWATLLRAGRLDETASRHAIATIEKAARSQATLIEDILDMSRIIRGKLTLNVLQVDLATVIRAALDSLRLAADAKGINLQVVIQEPAPVVSGDPDRLQQVVWNLISNAVKFTPEHGSVRIELEFHESHACLTVSDTGRGISPNLLPYVFEAFRQEDSSSTRRYGGLGLGLGIVRQIVELHGGTVFAESAGEGKGATFRIYLPATVHVQEHPKEERIGATAQAPRMQESASVLDGMRLLLLDDEPNSLEVLTTVFSDTGAQITPCSSVRAAMELLKSWRPNLILSDIAMPEEDGYALISKVRATEEGKNIPVVAVTAYARAEDRARILSAGFNLFIPKPIEPEKLLQSIISLIGNTPR